MVSTKFPILVFTFLSLGNVFSQVSLKHLSLDEAYSLLEDRYPSLRDGDVIRAIHDKEQLKLDIARKPEIFLKADARLQTESAQLELPEGTTVPFTIDLPIYSAKTYVEGQYSLIDGGLNTAQKKVKDIALKAELQQIEVKRYALRERINQLFVNSSILRTQIGLFDISLKDLDTRKKRVLSSVEEGVLIRSDLSKIQVKELEIQSQKDNVVYRLKGLINTLSELLDVTLSDDISFIFPSFNDPLLIQPIVRPEQELFLLQQQAIVANEDVIIAARKPKLQAYAQAGVGYPNPLNFLESTTSPYGIVGVQFNWKITDWNKDKIDKEILSLQAQRVQNAKETFEFNLNTRTASYLAEVERLSRQLEKDKEIIKLQSNILEMLAFQLDEGIIASSEYITQVNTELRARQNALIHQTELLKVQVEFWNERGGN